MTAKDLKNEILLFTNDVVFLYHNKVVCINPWTEHRYEVGFGDDFFRTYDSIEAVMSDPVYDGKCLSEIADEIIYP